VACWILKAWLELPKEMIMKAFKVAGLVPSPSQQLQEQTLQEVEDGEEDEDFVGEGDFADQSESDSDSDFE